MKNLLNFVIKLAFTFLILFLLIPVFGKSTVTQTMITRLILVILAYIAVDLWVLPKFGNLVAVLAELGLAALVIWVMMKALPHFNLTAIGVWTIALAFALCEWLFHMFLLTTTASGKKVDSP